MNEMSSPPFVSGITIFLDEEQFIEEAITSVLAQTYNHWELLLIDDGSTDRSTAIAKHYAKQYPDKISYFEHEGHLNKGMSASRNLGIAHAKGDYIAFLDADDVWLPQKLSEQVSLLESQPEAAMLYGRTQYWHSWTGKPEDAFKDCLTKQGIQPNQLIAPPTLLKLYLNDGQIYPCTCSIIVRRQTLETFGNFEEEFRNANEDMVFYSKVFLEAPIFVASKCWDRYRMNPNSYWSSYWAENPAKTWFAYPNHPHPEHYRYLKWLEGYLNRREIGNNEVWVALRRALWRYQHPTLYRIMIMPFEYLCWQLRGFIVRTGQRIVPIKFRHCLRRHLSA